MRSIWFWIIVMFLWLLLGWWLCKKYLCGTTPAKAAVVAPVTTGSNCDVFKISDNNFNVNTSGNVRFLRSDHNHLTGSSISNVMTQVATYLSNNATRFLNITGYYDSGETNSNSSFSNLGQSRAEDVKAWLITLGVPAGQIRTSSNMSSGCFDGNTLTRGVAFDFTSN